MQVRAQPHKRSYGCCVVRKIAPRPCYMGASRCVSDGAAHAPPAAAPAGTSRTKHHRTEGVCPPGCTSFIIRSAPPITAYLRLDVSGRSCLSCCCFAKLNAGSNNTRAVFAPARAERKANSLSRSTRAAPLMSVSIGGGGAMGAAVQQSLSTLPGAGAPPAPPPGYSAAVDAFRAAQRELQVRRGSKRGALARGPPASAPTSRAHPTPRCSWQLRPSRACARKKMRATWSARCVSAGGAAMRGTAQPRALSARRRRRRCRNNNHNYLCRCRAPCSPSLCGCAGARSAQARRDGVQADGPDARAAGAGRRALRRRRPPRVFGKGAVRGRRRCLAAKRAICRARYSPTRRRTPARASTRRQRLEDNIKRAQEKQLAARRTLLEMQQSMAGGPRR